MVDYASITPMMSLSTLLVIFIASLAVGATIVEIVGSLEEIKRPKPDVSETLTPSQKAVQRYYSERRSSKDKELTDN